MKILDGGMGRYLKEIGAPFEQPEWSALALMEEPSAVSKAHNAFIDAGAQIITTNSYAVVPFHIGEERFSQRGAELLALAGKLARDVKESRSDDVIVAASIPPVFGSYKPSEFETKAGISMLTVFKQYLLPHTDVVLAETISCIKEILAIQSVFDDSGQPLWLSLTLEDENYSSDPRLRSGESLSDAIEYMDIKNIKALLFNCSQPEVMGAAVAMACKKIPMGTEIGVYANGFKPISNTIEANDGYSTMREDLTPESYLEFAKQWKAQGATIVGGCCGVGVEHISMLKALQD